MRAPPSGEYPRSYPSSPSREGALIQKKKKKKVFIPTCSHRGANSSHSCTLYVCRYAFIFDYLINSYCEMKYCTTKAAAPPILLQEHGLGMPEGAPFKTCVNIAILRLKEEGFLQGLKKKSVSKEGSVSSSSSSPSPSR